MALPHSQILRVPAHASMEAAATLMRSKPGGAFVFVSDFDTNGVLWWLGTAGDTTTYINPHTHLWQGRRGAKLRLDGHEAGLRRARAGG